MMPITHAIPSSRTIQTALLSLLLLLTGLSILYAQSEDLNKIIEAEKKKLERMRKDQEQYVARVEALKKKGSRISTEVDQLDRKVHTTQRALQKIRMEEKRLKQSIAMAHTSLDETQKNLVQTGHSSGFRKTGWSKATAHNSNSGSAKSRRRTASKNRKNRKNRR
ncbi:MAG: hypothetical protein B1H02_05565 [Candidatus Latescibacteria bacterium 4484_107]|nr:MAG: hypothetical protein B1H02_05565 [Candidatus Latescibacteria bacterium 4484_107]